MSSWAPSWVTFLSALVHSNLIIAGAATAVAVTTIILAELPVDWLPLVFVFIATWFAYTLNRFTDRVEDVRNLPGRVAFIDRYGRWMLGLGVTGYLGLLVVVAAWEPWMLPIGILPGVAIGLYATDAATRYFPLKNGFVGLVWAMIPLGMGSYYGRPGDPAILVIAVVIMIAITTAAAIFDIKDIVGDRAAGSQTLPVLVGWKRTRYFAVLGIATSVPIVVWASLAVTSRLVVLGVYVGYLAPMFLLARPDRGPLYYGLCVDGEHLLVAMVAVILAGVL